MQLLMNTKKRMILQILNNFFSLSILTCFSSALSFKTCIASGTCGAVTAGTSRLNIPAFCQAICSIVLPNILTWSKPNDVIPHAIGVLYIYIFFKIEKKR